MIDAASVVMISSCVMEAHSDIIKKQKAMNVALATATQKAKFLKLVTRLAILYADRRDLRKSPGVPDAAMAIFADRRDRRIKSPIAGMSDIGD